MVFFLSFKTRLDLVHVCLFVLYGIWTLCTGSFQIKKMLKTSSINSSSIENKFLVYLVHSLQLQTIKSSILISYINSKGLNWRHISCSPDPTTNFESAKSLILLKYLSLKLFTMTKNTKINSAVEHITDCGP